MQHLLVCFLWLAVLPPITEGRTVKSTPTDNFLLPSGEKPEPKMTITVQPKSKTMTTLGSSVTLSCAGTATIGTPTIAWLFTVDITPEISSWTTLAGGTSGTLVLGNLQEEEGGYYFCQLSDGYGYSLVSQGALVIVTYLESEFAEYPEPQTVTNSQSYLKIPCQPPPSNPAATVNWYKDDTLVESVENMFQEYKSESEYGSLIIFNPSTSDSGDYACEAVNVNANPERRKTSAITIDIQVDGQGTYAQKFVQDHYVLVKKGDDAVLTAGATGWPVPEYKWTLGVSTEIDTSSGSRFSTADYGRQLLISNVKTEDRGTYWGQYKNVYTDSAVVVVRLYVIEDIAFDTILSAKTVEHLTPLTFDCQCSGTPYTSGDPTAPPSVLWLRDGQSIVDGDRFKQEDGSLIMSGLEMTEAGMYQCFCYNTLEITQSYMSVTVKNMTLPVSIEGPDIAEAVYSQNIWITCIALGYPVPVVTWYKDSAEVSASYDDRYTITQQATTNKVTSVLRVIAARESDVGTLICRAVNQKVDTYTAQLSIDFVVGHEIAPSITLSDISIQLNSQITVEAVVFGYPTPNVTWYKGEDRVPIRTGGRYTAQSAILIIDEAQSSDQGLYIVMASNGVGEDAFANATISIGVNTTLLVGSAGGICGLFLVLSILILLYILFRQKQKKEYVPPLTAPTPSEQEIEKRIRMSRSSASPVGFNPKPGLGEIPKQSVYLRENPALTEINTKSRNLPPIIRGPLDSAKDSITSEESDSDSSSYNSNTKIVPSRVKKSKVAPSNA